jgi:peptidoglycan/LPS O-acetylase OafA/YrhL
MNFNTLLQNKKYTNDELLALEKWRGLLSLIVVIAHLFQIFYFPIVGTGGWIALICGTCANISVVCFFVLSGMLISYSGLNLFTDNKFNWRRYIINRISRIYPALIFVLILCFILILIFPYFNESKQLIVGLKSDNYIARKTFFVSKIDIVLALFMIPTSIIEINGALWSLFIEWWLYFFGLFLFLIIGNRFKTKSIIILFIFLSILPLLLNYFFNSIVSLHYTFIWLTGFLYTFFLGKNNKIIDKAFILTFIILVIFISIFGVENINIVKALPSHYFLLQIFFSLFFLKIMFKIKLNKIFSWIGKFSYTLYIVHFPIILFTFSITRRNLNNEPLLVLSFMIFVFVIVIFFSFVISIFLEKKHTYQFFLIKLEDWLLKK